jgi:ferrous iron transport protein B
VIDERPDVVVDIVDASNLQRNLYLAVQFMELGTRLILVFNMSDLADTQGLDIDTDRLSEILGWPSSGPWATKAKRWRS